MNLRDVLVALAVLVGVLAVLGWRRGRRLRALLTGDPFFTDGLRAVLVFERRPVSLDQIEVFEWERPGTWASASPVERIRLASA